MLFQKKIVDEIAIHVGFEWAQMRAIKAKKKIGMRLFISYNVIQLGYKFWTIIIMLHIGLSKEMEAIKICQRYLG